MRWGKRKKPWFFRKKLEETKKQFHGHNKNEKTPGEKASFLPVCRKSIFDKLRMEVS